MRDWALAGATENKQTKTTHVVWDSVGWWWVHTRMQYGLILPSKENKRKSKEYSARIDSACVLIISFNYFSKSILMSEFFLIDYLLIIWCESRCTRYVHGLESSQTASSAEAHKVINHHTRWHDVLTPLSLSESGSDIIKKLKLINQFVCSFYVSFVLGSMERESPTQCSKKRVQSLPPSWRNKCSNNQRRILGNVLMFNFLHQ